VVDLFQEKAPPSGRCRCKCRCRCVNESQNKNLVRLSLCLFSPLSPFTSFNYCLRFLLLLESLSLSPPLDGTCLKLHTGWFIKNEFIQGENNNTFETINPSTGKAICRVAEASPSDVDYAIDTAVNAFNNPTWFGKEDSFS